MLRKIIKIDEALCNGCGACAEACHEGAIQMVNGKARLMRDDYCDGLGDCLPVCPTGAIRFEEREAAPYDAAAVAAKKNAAHAGGCPGHMARTLEHRAQHDTNATQEQGSAASQLRQWPVQIKLAPVNAPYFDGADLLIAADCTAYAFGDFHRRFIQGRITLIGCPKLDEGDYSEKLAAILSSNDIRSLTVVRMEVPCCGGIVNAAKAALQKSGKIIPWRVVTVSVDGGILSEI